MADDMANGNFDAQARYAALDERVTNLRTSMVNLEGEMRHGFSGLNSHLTSLSNELRTSQKTQWPVIWAAAGVAFSVLMGIGGALYLPMLSNIERLEVSIKDIRAGTVSREELDSRSVRGAEDRSRIEAEVSGLRSTAVARDEWLQQIHGRDQEVAELGRRIEELRQTIGNQYTTRDLLLDLRGRLDHVERDAPRTGLP